MKIIAYRVVTAYDLMALSSFVERFLLDGWQPYGVPVPYGESLAQAMVKYEPAPAP